MEYDAFTKCHPAVNLVFFAGAIGLCLTIQHPAYLLVGMLSSAVYYLILNGKKGWKTILGLIPMFLLLMGINPFFNLYGKTVLFYMFSRPYTLEALLYGAAVAAVFVVMMLWFGCYNKVLSGDKFTSLFGNIIPSLSLLLVMVFRMVPSLIRKAQQITGARKSIGKGSGENVSYKEKLSDGMTVLGTLTSWALEGSVVTGDSMRARGYGTDKRTSFMIYRMTIMDRSLLVIMIVLAAMVIGTAAVGGTKATFTPDFYIEPIAGTNLFGFIAYCFFLFIPTVLHIKEVVQWRISKLKI